MRLLAKTEGSLRVRVLQYFLTNLLKIAPNTNILGSSNLDSSKHTKFKISCSPGCNCLKIILPTLQMARADNISLPGSK